MNMFCPKYTNARCKIEIRLIHNFSNFTDRCINLNPTGIIYARKRLYGSISRKSISVGDCSPNGLRSHVPSTSIASQEKWGPREIRKRSYFGMKLQPSDIHLDRLGWWENNGWFGAGFPRWNKNRRGNSYSRSLGNDLVSRAIAAV